MGRTRSPDFLDRLLEAGLAVFAAQGLKRARIGDVADRMGVAHGTLYNYVESKEALFWLLVDRGQTTAPIELPNELPVKAPPPARVLGRLAEQIATHFPLPALDAALARDRIENVRAELEDVLGELYDRTLQTRQLAAAVEKSAIDLPEMFQLFFLGIRRDLFARLTRYIRQRVDAGHFAPVVDAEVAAHVIGETITAFARHRFTDPDPMNVDESAIRATTIQMLVRSLIPQEQS